LHVVTGYHSQFRIRKVDHVLMSENISDESGISLYDYRICKKEFISSKIDIEQVHRTL